ncbi:hypothetical protein STTU_6151 [Streptomyces sp. Tu6071]|uniref:NfeD-like C-terminal domain-containing protein n=1 Tax=Streptomyces evansiae TaxID=3075535 RepID=A0ABD5E1G9_9ACTN|nr:MULTISPECIES: hypothetical protein [unclassified Streptomyces]ASY36158.1 hypothetical protein CAC01_28580 [Streptomyces sp. CLI2509]EGJ78940.1 hypothetical protein STTU_6151 [Streptomyces sp. Tu6071]MDT0414924.1 hypothetical protein [Streptomyces sp. DSM 41982]MYX20285.1 hypothetical protein [Streptomyces sp. SID8380]SCD49641.1 hypothetical protein GA0115246_102443 [Streptomyces sp. SolWspMP-sol7th]
MTWFLVAGVAGLAVLALSLVVDGLLEGLFDGVSFLDGLLDGLFSLPVLAGTVSMLGFTGALTLATTGLGTGAAAGIGLAAGLVAGWLTWRLTRALMSGTTAATPRGADLVGTSGAVVTAIPAEGFGEVLLSLGGQPVKYAARSTVAVPRGAEVWVEETLSATAVRVRLVER